MYLVDTDVISEQRKRDKANPGAREFFKEASRSGAAVYLSVITVGELRTGVERIRHRGDRPQAARLERWLNAILAQYEEFILPVDAAIAEIWGRLRVPHPENPLDKQIAATALVYGLTVVTRNSSDFSSTGADILNPFT